MRCVRCKLLGRIVSRLYDDEMDIWGPRCFHLDAKSAQQWEDAPPVRASCVGRARGSMVGGGACWHSSGPGRCRARACARAPWEQPPVAILITICTETMIPYSLCPCSVCPPSHRSSCYVEFSCRLRSALGSCWGITAVLPLYEPQTVLLTAVNASPPQEPATEQ